MLHGWRGTLRSINALLREAERDARRRAGQQLRAERERLAQLGRQHATAAVQEYKSYINFSYFGPVVLSSACRVELQSRYRGNTVDVRAS
jgi:hypothetical protein